MIRWIFVALGFIALAVLIWFGGPAIAISEHRILESVTSRILLFIIILLSWAVFQLWKQIKAKKDNDGLISGIEESNEQAVSHIDGNAADVSQLQNNFSDALSILKSTKLKGVHGEQKLYELPWYIIIGPPGSGKTTALVNSGLRFPLGDHFGKQALRGVGGTRDCDFWFTDEAVLVDTAGRYTTQDSDATADKAGWDGFLGLLKRHRKRRPINGVLVAISLSELMGQSDQERMNHATIVKRRVQELYQKLGIQFPVYVLFTKTDLIAGFAEFFDDTGREERAQVWGTTFPMDSSSSPDGVAHLFSGEFDSLVARLNERLNTRLHQERDLNRRNQILNFPHQLASLKQVADAFLQDVFRPHRFEDRFLLRGVYFTSGTQEGTPIDRIMGSLAGIFGLDRQAAPMFSGQGKSYFLTNLFKDVIFQESGIAGTDQKLEKQRMWLVRAAYASAVIATIGATLTWTGSYTANANHLDTVQEHLAQYQVEKSNLKPSDGLQEILPALASLKMAGNVYQQSGLTWLSSLGLSKRGSIEPVADEAYRRALVDDFLPRLARRLEQQMTRGSQETDYLHSALKSYLMLNDHSHLEPEFVKNWMHLDWQTIFAGDTERQQQLKDHLNVLLERKFDPIELSPSVVNRTRTILAQIPPARQVYNRLKQQADSEYNYSIDLNEILTVGAKNVFEFKDQASAITTIPGIFTYKGFNRIYLAQSLEFSEQTTAENWVMGEKFSRSLQNVDPDKINEEVKQYYLDDYIATWGHALNNLKITRFRSLSHAAEMLEILAGPESPVRNILVALDQNTSLNRLPAGTDKAGSSAKAAASLSSKTSRIANIANKINKTGVGSMVNGPGTPIEKYFEPINALVQSSRPGSASVNKLLNLLAETHTYLFDLGASSGGGPALQAASSRMNGARDAISSLRSFSTQLQQPVKSWVQSIAYNSWSVILGRARAHVDSLWKSELLPVYQRAIKNRYPVNRDADREITLADFSSFFGPDGTMDQFFDTNLKPFVNKTRWKQKAFENQTLGLSPQLIRAFRNATSIQKTFFRDGSGPTISFSLKPTYLDANIDRFSLSIDGQSINYRHGPMRSVNLTWPGPDGSTQSRISFEASSGTHTSRTKDGAWGWFRLLDQSDVQATTTRDRYRVTFQINRHKARYDLFANSVVNPFRMKSLEQFYCPESI